MLRERSSVANYGHPVNLPNGDAVMVFLVDDRQHTLMVRAHGQLNDYWMPPGGHIDPGETAPIAACRELVEELDLHLSPDDLSELGGCTKDFGTGPLPLFESRRWLAGPMNLGPEIHEAKWVALADCAALPTLPATDYGLQLVRERTNGQGVIT